jgi:hypothetical protein
MLRTQNFKVVRNRMQFRCPICGVKRSLSVPSGIRKKNLRCHKCGEMVKCALNRRVYPRELLSGKMIMVTPEGTEVDVFISDKSAGGAGFDLSITDIRRNRIATGIEVRFRCSWSPLLVGNSRFVIVNIKGQRIGVKRIVRGGF